MKLNLSEYEALNALSGHPAWDRLLDAMKASLAQERAHNDLQQNDVLLRQAQGRCQVLNTLIEGTAAAPEILRKQRRP